MPVDPMEVERLRLRMMKAQAELEEAQRVQAMDEASFTQTYLEAPPATLTHRLSTLAVRESLV